MIDEEAVLMSGDIRKIESWLDKPTKNKTYRRIKILLRY
jgi:hypothetical protein